MASMMLFDIDNDELIDTVLPISNQTSSNPNRVVDISLMNEGFKLLEV